MKQIGKHYLRWLLSRVKGYLWKKVLWVKLRDEGEK
jgi:hypothetical protein